MDPGHSIVRHLVAESPFHTEILWHDPKHFGVLDTAALYRVDHGEGQQCLVGSYTLQQRATGAKGSTNGI